MLNPEIYKAAVPTITTEHVIITDKQLEHPVELIVLKVKLLLCKGYSELRLPFEAHGDFLGN